MKRLQKKYELMILFGNSVVSLFSFFLSAYDLAHRRTLDNDDTPTLDANCPSEGKEPLLIGGECFLLHDGAGVVFALIFWVV
jgi:hypothetical protein